MDLLEAIILGILQGLTEFLPISSSAHLRIMGEIAGWSDPGATFTAITQLGTEIAVLGYFWGDITRIIGKWFRAQLGGVPKNHPDVRLGWLVIIGTVPIVLAGFFLQDLIRTTFRSLWLVAIVLIVFGVLLGFADMYAKQEKKLKQLSYRHGVTIGFAQMLALIPGVSRSGASVSAARMLGYTRTASTRFAFLLAVPAVFGSGLYELVTALSCTPGVDAGCGRGYGLAETFAATVVAFGVGLAVIAWLMRYLEKHSFMPFVVYRILLGGVLLLLLGTGAL